MSRSQIALLSVVTVVGVTNPVDPTLPVAPENTPPSVVIEAPADGGWLTSGVAVPFKVAVTDAEDGAVDCTKVVVSYGDPPVEAAPGPDCTGVLAPDTEHLSATYTDAGGLTGSAETVLHPREFQGPAFGVNLAAPQNWFAFPHINLAGITHLTVEFVAPQPDENVTVHADAPDGPLIASFANVPAGWQAADVTDPGGVHDLYFVTDRADGMPPTLGVRLIRFQTVPEVAATVTPATPASGWHTTDATVSVGAVPLWQQQISFDGGATWLPADAPTTVTAEGTSVIQYRAADAAGRTSPVGTTTVRVDKTAPAVAAVIPQHGHSTVLDLPAVTDAGSGVASGAVTLDGAPVTASVELWRLPAGTHDLTVTAVDAAGNTTTSTTKLEITTSLDELLPLMTRFPMPFVKSLILRFQLMAAESAVQDGRVTEAMVWVSAFHASSATLRDPAAKANLTADADLVLAQVSSPTG